MENRDLLNQYIDAVVKKDDAAAETAFKQFVTAKTANIVAEIRAKGEFTEKLNEIVGQDRIQFHGDDVLVDGKVVGQVKTDYNDENSAIDFIYNEGRASKEFLSVEDLFQFIAKTFNVNENTMTGNLGTKIETPKVVDLQDEEEPKMPPHDNAADLKGQTKGEFNPDSESSDGLTARGKKLKGIIATIKGGGRPTSTKVTENGEWTMKNSDVDASKGAKLKTQTKKMRKKADASGNAK